VTLPRSAGAASPANDDDLLSSYTFDLPEDRIAQRPLEKRSDARLLVVRQDGLQHRVVRDLPELLNEGDLLVVNDTTVVPARLYGEKAGTGGRVEVLIVRSDGASWICLVNASKKPKPGTRLVFGTGQSHTLDAFFATVEGSVDDEPGAFRLRFDGDPIAFAKMWGHVPLPPYIARDDDDDDISRYQTLFADPQKSGSSAAPTAGLHFDDELRAALDKRGVKIAKVTLHVGPGTFLPVRAEKLSEHVMHPEPWWISEETASLVNATRDAGKRVIAVGTTSLRALESSLKNDRVSAGSGLTRLFLHPPKKVRSIDAMITNFHLPGSTLFALVCAVAGKDRMKNAYAEAIREGYRFYSYGDASFLEVLRSDGTSPSAA
jgi:S-adenosylmethionine:tRNA ribosyltransferase-isomerase